MDWKTLKFSPSRIEHETEKAVLIKMPDKSEYAGYKFWHPAKLIRIDKENKNLKTISFTDEFEFKLKKNGEGDQSREVVDEVTLSAEDFEKEFAS